MLKISPFMDRLAGRTLGTSGSVDPSVQSIYDSARISAVFPVRDGVGKTNSR